MAGESDSISSEAFLRSAEEDSGEQTDRSRKGQCGKSVFEGIAIGKIRLIKIKKRNIVCVHVEDVLTDKTGVLAFRGIPDKIYIAK